MAAPPAKAGGSGEFVVATTTTVDLAGPGAVVLGAALMADVEVVTADGSAAAGSVKVRVDGQVVGSLPLDSSGVISLGLPLNAVGGHTVDASFAPANPTVQKASSSDPATYTVTKADTRLQASIAETVPYQGGVLSVAVSAVDSRAVAAGTVEVREGNVSRGIVVLDEGGTGSMSVAGLAPGPHTLDLVYGGDGRTWESAETVRFTVSKATTRVRAEVQADGEMGAPAEVVPYGTGQVAIEAVGLDGEVVPSGMVVVSENGTGRSNAILDPAGRSSVQLDGYAPGTHTLDLDYLGDTLSGPSSTSVTFTIGEISKAASTTSLELQFQRTLPRGAASSGAAASQSLGETTVSAVATVASPGGVPDGRVSVFVDGKAVSTQAAGTGGVSVQLPAAMVRAPGEHTVMARYLGSSTQEPSVSETLTYTGTGEPDPAAKATSRLTAALKALRKHRVRVTASVTSSRLLSGQVQVLVANPRRPETMKVLGSAVIRTTAQAGRIGRVRVVLTTPALAKGVRTLAVRYLGSAEVSASAATAKVRIR
ncbi:hypothetical protein GCM10009795_096910 [Nocardioides hankookensis]|uniref:Ig-like domain-containing protein n=1 Tax=Nocardioides hankookensis TaxID=443157 RepID=A0ABW1LNI9_9ACTN